MQPTPKRARTEKGQQKLLRFCSPANMSQIDETPCTSAISPGLDDEASNSSVDTPTSEISIDTFETESCSSGHSEASIQDSVTPTPTPDSSPEQRPCHSEDDFYSVDSSSTHDLNRSISNASTNESFSQPSRSDSLNGRASSERPASSPSSSRSICVTPVSAATGSSSNNCPQEANQPPPSSLPKQHLPSKTLSFQQHWYDEWTWLHWQDGKLLCLYCSVINPLDNLPHIKKCDPAFIKYGYKNWKMAKQKFADHQKSQGHGDSMKLFLGQNKQNISGRLNKQHLSQQQKARKCLKVIVTSLKYLGREGCSIRGSDYDTGKFISLLRTRSHDVPEMVSWLSRLDSNTARQRHLLSADIQNEILRDYSHTILRKLQTMFTESASFGLICDGTQDCSGTEQQAICIRYVDSDLVPKECFVGLYEVSDTSGAGISSMLQDVCKRLQLPMAKLRGQAYDGASNMSGAYSGVQARIMQLQPLAHYSHCGAHVVNLVSQSAIGSCDWVRDCVSIANELGVLFSTTIKYRQQFAKLVAGEEGPKKLKPLCPTRWSLKYEGINTVVTRYSELIESLKAFLKTNITTDQKTKANGILSRMDNGSTYMGLACVKPVLSHLNDLSKVLQSDAITLEGTLEAVKTCRAKLQQLRDDFDNFFETTDKSVAKLDLAPLALPRKRKPPARYTGPAAAHQPDSVLSHYRKKFNEAVDTARSGLKPRIKHDVGIASYLKLLAVFEGKLDKDEIDKFPELNYDTLAEELPLFQKKFQVHSLASAANALRECHKEVRMLFPGMEALVRLLLVRPATSCEAERSFSALRRLKNYLRSTMTAPRLNAITLMHVHQELLDTIDDDKIIQQFIMRNQWRKVTFGKQLQG